MLSEELNRCQERDIPPNELQEDIQDIQEDSMQRQVSALIAMLCDLYGTDKLVLKAGKVEALHLMRSEKLGDRVLALQRLIFEDPTLESTPDLAKVPEVLEELEEEIADIIARRSVEEKLERKIAERMQQRHDEYLKEVRMQIIKDNSGPENAQTLKRLAVLERLEQIKLSRSALEILRPQKVSEIIGQEKAVQGVLSKLASPYPQHIIFYGPPGVGKTTVARIALEQAKGLPHTPFAAEAPFIEVNGATLRWDPRDITNPLLGSVHDPIYQGARRDLADSGTPEPKLGLVTDSHGGVLFVDEIGEMDPMLLNKLLKVLEDKRVRFDSSYYDSLDPNVPQYIKKLFEEGAPADFILIGATTRDPSELNPALRSRCAEVYFDPLTPTDIQKIVKQAAHKLQVAIAEGAAKLISEYTIEGRKAISLLADAYGLALYQQPDNEIFITNELVSEGLRIGRLSPFATVSTSPTAEIGRILGLAVRGFVGSIVEIEAIAFPVEELSKASIRFNETAGSMAKDSVFNAAAVIRKISGKHLADYDLHINVVGGGNIDGPSAGLAICLVMLSAIQGHAICQEVAITGEISIRGKVKSVGGICEKLYGARQAGVKTVIIPWDNLVDVPPDLQGVKVIGVRTVEEAIPHLLTNKTEQKAG